MTRRDFIHQTSLLACATLASSKRFIEAAPSRSRMGIASTSFAGAEISGSVTPGSTPRPRARDAYEFLEKCAALGAGGIQTQLNGDLNRLRARAEELGMWIEGMAPIPRNGDMAPLERSLIDAKTAGATVVRAAMLSGRRYESFTTLADWKKWVDQSHEALRLAMPVIERQKIFVAIENHKDWTVEEMVRLLRTYSSEHLGVCLDFGNNIALLDDPMEVVEGLAPFARSTHVKDMGLHSNKDGFLLSEVRLGSGMLDLRAIIDRVQKANPKINFTLEMITRDPLKVPCLTPQYWNVFPDRNGRYLARTLKLVEEHSSELPVVSNLGREERMKVEEENVKACLSASSGLLG